MSWLSDVRAFMQLGHPEKIAAAPTMPPKDIRKLCHDLIEEETVRELLPAIRDNENIVEIADAIADGIYVHLFAAVCYGIPMNDVWAAVQRSNMAKFLDENGNHIVVRDTTTGKILKPTGWQPPTAEITRAIVLKIEEEKLFCPRCGKRHHDVGVWAERPHRTHLCVTDKFGTGCNASFRVQRSALLFGSGLE